MTSSNDLASLLTLLKDPAKLEERLRSLQETESRLTESYKRLNNEREELERATEVSRKRLEEESAILAKQKS